MSLIEQFKTFYLNHHFEDMSRCIELFAIFGSLNVSLDEFSSNQMLIEKHLFDNIGELYNSISNRLLDEPKYARLLHALAIGDRKMISAFKRAHIKEKDGGNYLNYLLESGLIRIEYSREINPRLLYKHPKKELLRHRIVHKVRFNDPFIRFFYAFISPHLDEILKGEYQKFYTRYDKRFNTHMGFHFEDLALIYLNKTMTITQNGSFWNKDTEIDILAVDDRAKIIVGECKWTNTKINKKEIHKLQEKCNLVPIKANKMIFFSKSGFSNEMHKLKNEALLLVEAQDFLHLI